jgi:hypothetical protein
MDLNLFMNFLALPATDGGFNCQLVQFRYQCAREKNFKTNLWSGEIALVMNEKTVESCRVVHNRITLVTVTQCRVGVKDLFSSVQLKRSTNYIKFA